MAEKATPAEPAGRESSGSVADKRQRGQQRLRARRAGIRRIRVRIAAGAVCLFLACWLTIFGVLVEGKDPALSANARRDAADVSTAVKSTTLTSHKASSATEAKATSTQAKSSEALAGETVSSSGESEGSSESSESAGAKSSATPMTTSQS
jgi:hypothetical protein